MHQTIGCFQKFCPAFSVSPDDDRKPFRDLEGRSMEGCAPLCSFCRGDPNCSVIHFKRSDTRSTKELESFRTRFSYSLLSKSVICRKSSFPRVIFLRICILCSPSSVFTIQTCKIPRHSAVRSTAWMNKKKVPRINVPVGTNFRPLVHRQSWKERRVPEQGENEKSTCKSWLLCPPSSTSRNCVVRLLKT